MLGWAHPSVARGGRRVADVEHRRARRRAGRSDPVPHVDAGAGSRSERRGVAERCPASSADACAALPDRVGRLTQRGDLDTRTDANPCSQPDANAGAGSSSRRGAEPVSIPRRGDGRLRK